MNAVEKPTKPRLVRIGFGKMGHRAALMTAGAERVILYPEHTDVIIHGGGLRKGDVLLVAQPTILSVQQYQRAKEGCFGVLRFQVVGGEPMELVSEDDYRQFRKLKARIPELAITQSTGRPKTIKYSVEQADAIIRLWHEKPKRKPADIVLLADTILGLDAGTVKHHWVRDLVRKYTGTAKRDKPEGWRGVKLN